MVGGPEYSLEATAIYKERFPKAKHQMETRLQQFLVANAHLSGFTTSVALNIPPPRSSSPRTTPMPTFEAVRIRPTSPRPPSPMRPISPLVTESATAIGDEGIMLRSSRNSSAANILASPGSSFFSAAGGFIPQNLQTTTNITSSTDNNSESCGDSVISCMAVGMQSTQDEEVHSGLRSHRCSFMVTASECLSSSNPQLLQLISDGATRFLHHQICEIVADCLQKSRDDILSCSYFCGMSLRLEETLAEAETKTGPESYKYLARLVRQILMIVSRTARLLECLEFNPDEFYHLLEEAEGVVRVQLGSGTARVPDLPQYILGKLGLNKNLQLEHNDVELSPEEEKEQILSDAKLIYDEEETKREVADSIERSIAMRAPKEEDFETIRLISNGAYGAVYLVRHKKTRQRFALKKMKKQTLLLRNQVDQVYAERDILTFTDNPFVVCFYGSFETKQHLCMLMEYVEGGDCAALLKSAGTLPIELTRLYIAETVLAIEYLHSCGIVHRDLKPDNLLITSMGHIKLTDFGLSKIGLMNRTTLVSEGYLDDTQQFKDNQLCGTPEYIAPEVILRQGYGKPVDWWATGIILYEFLVGVVPFLGETPEILFSNIINEEVEYPEEDEALDQDAESLIRLLLEKNPVDRLGTHGGAPQVMEHPFFSSLDFDSILRQKAEFVPQLENDEDTSYFDSRTDRYNHEAESGDDESVPMFWSFSTASPRHSIVGLELPPGGLAGLQALAASSSEGSSINEQTGEEASLGILRQFSSTGQSDDGSTYRNRNHAGQQLSTDSGKLPPLSNNIAVKYPDGVGQSLDAAIPSAVILRRRFSTQRRGNPSTSSSGTNNTTGAINTCSSTDSSLDTGYFQCTGTIESQLTSGASAGRRQNQSINASSSLLVNPLPRFAISPCEQQNHHATSGSIARRATIGDESRILIKEKQQYEEKNRQNAATLGANNATELVLADEKKHGHDANNAYLPIKEQQQCRTNRTDSLRVLIPGQSLQSASNSPAAPQSTTSSSNLNTSYYHSYGGGSSGQLSPSCNSVSSISSFGSNSPNPKNPSNQTGGGGDPFSGQDTRDKAVSPQLSLIGGASTSSHHLQQHLQLPGNVNSKASRPIVIKKGPQGYGFTVRSVRVYLSESSDYYTIEHIVSAVKENTPAYEAGLRENDFLTHIHTQSVHNMTHPQLMHRLLSCGNEITLHVIPLNNTTIREGEARKNVGKLLRKKPKKTQRRVPMEKKPRKASALLRRLSGKRTAGEIIIPGASTQKQTFMPRSTSSQEGALGVVNPSAPKPQRVLGRTFY